MPKAARGFTLVELLTVTAIIGVLASILFPIVVEARKKGDYAVSISNLRQCGLALLIYSEDFGGIRAMPTRPAADQVLAQAPTCDPGDYFRASCEAPASPPMIGSYAYVRDSTVYGTEEGWSFFVNSHRNGESSVALLMNLFVSTKRHSPSQWFVPYARDYLKENPHPDRIQVFEADGGVRLYRPRSRPDIGYTWLTLFGMK